MKRLFIYLLIILVHSNCERTEKKTSYFDGGNKIEMESEFKNGQRDGLEIHYYRNGQIKLKSHYSKGKLHGESFEYYPNGVPVNIRNYFKGVRVGESKVYYESGRLMEIQYYDSVGKILEFKRFLENGKRDKKTLAPLLWINKDTLSRGDSLHLEVRLGNITDFNLNRGKMVIGSQFGVRKDGEQGDLIDTLCEVESQSNLYKYNMVALVKGNNFIRGFLTSGLYAQEKDSVYKVFFEYRYFVK